MKQDPDRSDSLHPAPGRPCAAPGPKMAATATSAFPQRGGHIRLRGDGNPQRRGAGCGRWPAHLPPGRHHLRRQANGEFQRRDRRRDVLRNLHRRIGLLGLLHGRRRQPDRPADVDGQSGLGLQHRCRQGDLRGRRHDSHRRREAHLSTECQRPPPRRGEWRSKPESGQAARLTEVSRYRQQIAPVRTRWTGVQTIVTDVARTKEEPEAHAKRTAPLRQCHAESRDRGLRTRIPMLGPL